MELSLSDSSLDEDYFYSFNTLRKSGNLLLEQNFTLYKYRCICVDPEGGIAIGISNNTNPDIGIALIWYYH